MLDADESNRFDEEARLNPELRLAVAEIDRLTSSLAIATAAPIVPNAGQLDRLHLRLGLSEARKYNWAGITGWAAAASLLLSWTFIQGPTKEYVSRGPIPSDKPSANLTEPVSPADRTLLSDSSEPTVASQRDEIPDGEIPMVLEQNSLVGRVETRQLVQEVTVLREQLARFKERDHQRNVRAAGVAWPIVMRMRPPGTASSVGNKILTEDEEPVLTAMLGDAIAATVNREATKIALDSPKTDVAPSAIPIYDPARDTGTIVINGELPATTTDESYQLWVTASNNETPVYVGTLPESETGAAQIFDFSLGSTSTFPSGFILTKGSKTGRVAPTSENTVLQGPD